MLNQPYLFHGQTAPWIERENDSLTIRFLCDNPNNEVTSLFIRCEPDNEENLIACEPISMPALTHRGQLYQAQIPLSQHIEISYYLIKAITATDQLWLSAKGIHKRMPGREFHFKYNAYNHPPKWVREQVFYQIFPDRFNNADDSISVKTGEYEYQGGRRPVVARAWNEPITTSDHNSTGATEFYGGDLLGIEHKLDYLQELGISALYLNPIFTSPSNHKYDTSDYRNVDPHLGTNEDFARLTSDVHSRNMKIMLDAVFNHTSCDHPWFGRYERQANSAYGKEDSPYRDYYLFSGNPNNNNDPYIGWNGVETLPKLNFANSKVQDYLYTQEDSVLRHWLKPPYNIDAWRFDVMHMLGEGTGAYNNAKYVRAFRQATKEVNPEAYFIGEHFFEATQWLQGDQEDGAMNYYGFAHPVRAFFANIDIAYQPVQLDAALFDDWLAEARAKIPWENQLAQLNQLDSHDTMRFISMLDNNEARFKAASMMLFSYPGTPCIYYGTEIGLQGGQDPDNRRPFPWDQVDSKQEMFGFYQNLITHRKERIELKEGNYQTLFASDKCFAFARSTQGKTSVYALNLGTKAQQLAIPRIKLMSDANQYAGFDNAQHDVVFNVMDDMLCFELHPEQAVLLSN